MQTVWGSLRRPIHHATVDDTTRLGLPDMDPSGTASQDCRENGQGWFFSGVDGTAVLWQSYGSCLGMFVPAPTNPSAILFHHQTRCVLQSAFGSAFYQGTACSAPWRWSKGKHLSSGQRRHNSRWNRVISGDQTIQTSQAGAIANNPN